MIRIGVTGGIGSGKSTVCEIFAALGIPVYNTDLRARELMSGAEMFGTSARDNTAEGGEHSGAIGENEPDVSVGAVCVAEAGNGRGESIRTKFEVAVGESIRAEFGTRGEMGDNNLVEAGFDPEFGCDNGDARGHGSEQSVVAGDTVRGSERYGAAGTYRDECDRDSEQSVAAGTNERGANLRRAIVELLGAEAWCNGSLNREFIAAKVFSDKSLLASLNAIVHPIVAQDFEAWATTLESPARGMKERANVAAMALESPPAPTPPTIASQKTDPKTTSKAEAGTPPYLIMESAILFESGFNHLVDKVIAVSAPEELRIARVMARSSATEPNNPATARSSATPSGSNSTRNPETARVPGMASGRGPSRDDVIKRMSNQLSESELIARADYTIYNGGDLMQLAARVSELDKLLRLGDAKKNSPPQPKKQK